MCCKSQSATRGSVACGALQLLLSIGFIGAGIFLGIRIGQLAQQLGPENNGGIVAAILGAPLLGLIGFTLIFHILGGIFGILGGLKQSRGFLIAALVMCIFSIIFYFVDLIFYAVLTSVFKGDIRFTESYNCFLALTMLSLIEIVVAFFHSCFCCSVTCCGKLESDSYVA